MTKDEARLAVMGAISMTLEDPILQQGFEIICKENAELREFVNAPHTKGRKTTRGDYIKTVWDLSKQLTKAKDHIKKLLGCLQQDTNDPQTNYYVVMYMTEAEQFLKESEVEK